MLYILKFCGLASFPFNFVFYCPVEALGWSRFQAHEHRLCFRRIEGGSIEGGSIEGGWEYWEAPPKKVPLWMWSPAITLSLLINLVLTLKLNHCYKLILQTWFFNLSLQQSLFIKIENDTNRPLLVEAQWMVGYSRNHKLISSHWLLLGFQNMIVSLLLIYLDFCYWTSSAWFVWDIKGIVKNLQS